jgi:GTPase SAR1 family protein
LGIIYIGDRSVGKTHLATELANPNNHYVKVNSPYLNTPPLPTDAQNSIHNKTIELEIQLPSGQKQLTLNWIDTPGEIWREHWQKQKATEWQNFLNTIQQTQGIILVLPPYRQIIIPSLDNPENYITEKQWCNRFNRWLDFFRDQCPQIRHLLLCLNKADLFSNSETEGKKLGYLPHNSLLNWQQRNTYVTQKYFRPIYPQIFQLNQSINGLSVRCFITTIYNRHLLELPWIYLGSFLT